MIWHSIFHYPQLLCDISESAPNNDDIFQKLRDTVFNLLQTEHQGQMQPNCLNNSSQAPFSSFLLVDSSDFSPSEIKLLRMSKDIVISFLWPWQEGCQEACPTYSSGIKPRNEAVKPLSTCLLLSLLWPLSPACLGAQVVSILRSSPHTVGCILKVSISGSIWACQPILEWCFLYFIQFYLVHHCG